MEDEVQTQICNTDAMIASSSSQPTLSMSQSFAVDEQIRMNEQSQMDSSKCCGYVAVSDNVDKNIHPSYQRQDRTTLSLHYFNSYA